MLIYSSSLAATANPVATERLNVERSSPPVARWELRTAPAALLASWFTIDAGYRFGSKFSTGPALVSYSAKRGNMFLPSFEGQALGWYANYYFRPATRSGWYSSVHAYQEDFVSHPHAARDDERFKRSGQRANVALGYRWSRSIIDVLIGGGMQFMNHQVDETKWVYTTFGSPGKLESSSRAESISVPFVEFKTGLQF
ncbi:MAG: hypothetical protein V4760_15685 [Bdellovibrionota bacterium]